MSQEVSGRQQQQRPIAAVITALVAAAVSFSIAAILLVHLHRVHRELVTRTAAVDQYRAVRAQSSRPAPELPHNTTLSVCNRGAQPVELVGVISSFRDPRTAALVTFNSSSLGQRAWQLPPRSRQTLRVDQGGRTIWDGSTIFFALAVRRGSRESLQVGDATQATGGCVAILAN